MNTVVVVAIVFGGIVLALAIVGSTILMAIRILKGGFSRKNRELETEEARLIQHIYRGLSTMEKRVEALETILLEKERKDFRT